MFYHLFNLEIPFAVVLSDVNWKIDSQSSNPTHNQISHNLGKCPCPLAPSVKMPELTGISCSTCGQSFANKRALLVHSHHCGSVSVSHNVRDVLRHGRGISSSTLRKRKIARTSEDINHAISSSSLQKTKNARTSEDINHATDPKIGLCVFCWQRLTLGNKTCWAGLFSRWLCFSP